MFVMALAFMLLSLRGQTEAKNLDQLHVSTTGQLTITLDATPSPMKVKQTGYMMLEAFNGGGDPVTGVWIDFDRPTVDGLAFRPNLIQIWDENTGELLCTQFPCRVGTIQPATTIAARIWFKALAAGQYSATWHVIYGGLDYPFGQPINVIQ